MATVTVLLNNTSLVLKCSLKHIARSSSWWGQVQMVPLDAILDFTKAYKRDTNTKNTNLGVGAYHDNNVKLHILPNVLMAEKRIFERVMDKKYVDIVDFCKYSIQLGLGDIDPAISEGKNVTVQGISGRHTVSVAPSCPTSLGIKRHLPAVAIVGQPYFSTQS